jgi:hypothetical protein
MRMRIVFNSWTHTNDYSPWTVRSKYEYRIVNCAELLMNNWLHFMPLIQFNWILRYIGTERHSSVSVSLVAIRKLGLEVDTIRFHKRFDMSQLFVEFVSHFVHEGKIGPWLHLHERRYWLDLA